jgi:hypothetical protein
MRRSAKRPSRDGLLRQLGEEALQLFQSGALPVPAKLRDTVASLETMKDDGPKSRARPKKK